MDELEAKASMCWWWPRIQRIPALRTPRTIEVAVPKGYNIVTVLDGVRPPESFVADIAAAGRKVGYPAFIRGDLVSGKHEWPSTCLLESPTSVSLHIHNLTEACYLAGPDIAPKAFFVRQLLDLEAEFVAFTGLPIARERRFFALDGHYECDHAYWPEAAIRFWPPLLEPTGWRDLLANRNRPVEPEDWRILRADAEWVSRVLGGVWSVDFAQDRQGLWWLIDTAPGEVSWHPDHEGDAASRREEG